VTFPGCFHGRQKRLTMTGPYERKQPAVTRLMFPWRRHGSEIQNIDRFLRLIWVDGNSFRLFPPCVSTGFPRKFKNYGIKSGRKNTASPATKSSGLRVQCRAFRCFLVAREGRKKPGNKFCDCLSPAAYRWPWSSSKALSNCVSWLAFNSAGFMPFSLSG